MRVKETLICTGKACGTHIQRHKKKYALGTAITIAIIVVGSFLTNITKTSGQEKEMLLIFYQIEDVAHQRQETINSLGHKMPQEEEFNMLEKKFHISQDLYERYKIAREIDKIIHLQDAYLDEIGYVNAAEDNYFNSLEKRFDAIK